MTKTIGTKGVNTFTGKPFLAYIVIPEDIDIEIYKQHCFRTKTVSLMTEEGKFVRRVRIDPALLQRVIFPKEKGKYGSCLLCFYINKHSIPIASSLIFLIDEYDDVQSENQVKLHQTLENDFIDLDSNVETGIINLTINKDKYALLNINVIGNEGDGGLKITTNGNVEVDNKQTTIRAEKIILGEGAEPVVLANTLKKIFDSFIDQVGAITVNTVFGASPILNKIQITEFKEQTKNFISQLTNTD